MYRLWISTCCFVVCLIIHHTPSSYCAAIDPSSSKAQQYHQQQEHQRPAETPDPKPPSPAPDDQQKTSEEQSEGENIITFTKSSRNKRELAGSQDEMKMAKRLRSFIGKRDWDLDSGTPAVGPKYPAYSPVQVWFDTVDGKFYLGYPGDEESSIDNGTDNPTADDDDVYRDVTKRLRTFVGKRGGSTQLEAPHNGGWYPEDDQEFDLSKRMRRFVGKRLRSFIGKRDDIDKRMRSFVGKRMRSFVGKRDGEYDFGNELFLQDKRPRRFVGKRLRSFIGKRTRSFVGKRESGADELIDDPFGGADFRENALFTNYPDKRTRRFVGKRSYGDEWDSLELPSPYAFNDGFGLSADKRLRTFVGKRSMDDNLIDAQKRLRSFVGKREDKRVRSFIGKRSDYYPDELQAQDPDLSKPSKRPRGFVSESGDRDELQLRDFVGKRDSDVSKRLRSFIGRR